MAMTSDDKTIKACTGLDVGKVFLNGKEYEPCKGNVYDLQTCNFHLYPRSADEEWEKYLENEKAVREELCKCIQRRLEPKEVGGKEYDSLKEKDPGDKWWYFSEGKGSASTAGEKWGRYFRFVSIFKGGIYYSINFKRFYIDTENKVNCIFGEYQFDATDDLYVNKKGKGEGKKDFIVYPHSFKGQNEKMIKIDKVGTGFTCMYNPKGLEFTNKKDAIEQVMDAFMDFADEVDRQVMKSGNS